MADLVGGAAGEIYKDGKCVATFAISNVLYLRHLKRNYNKLMEEARNLEEMRKFLGRRRFKVNSCIKGWIASASIIERQVKDLETKYNNEKKHRWKWFSLANLSKEMEVKCQEVCSHWKEGEHKKETAVMELPEPVKRKSTALKLEENSSLHKVLQHVLRCLEDKEIRRIGIWGKVGTGKTAVMENLNNHEKVAEMFKMVIHVTVSKGWSEKGVQDAILRRLKLDVEGIADVNEAALIISEELKGKKCLILLDEVRDMIDLNRIMGIDENPDSKVVFASRYDDFCKAMKADELVNVKPLLPTEAWNMFQKIVGDFISNPLIEPLARGVVKECHGLPLLIHSVALTFGEKGEYPALWDDGLERLKRWDSIKIKGKDEVLERLQICYDDLGDVELKDCFLYGALYPEGREIYVDYLLECWKAEGFIKRQSDLESNFRSARNRGHSVLIDLIKLALLERSDKRKCVKMNKVFRKMALRISSQNSKFLVKLREGLDFPKKEEWGQANRISLMGKQLSTLPGILDCRNLFTLLLQRNKYLTSIPQLFFKSMCRLKVLDLHGTKIVELPLSLSNLIDLKGLYLNSCSKLKKIPSSVKALQLLEVLDIRKTKLNLLQIRCLSWLKCLRFSLGNFDMENHTKAQVSTFHSLEELNIDVGSLKQEWNKIVDPVIKEVVELKKLTSLRFYFPEVDCLGLFVEKSPVWESSHLQFHFVVGYHNSAFAYVLESIDNPTYNILKLVGDGVNPDILKLVNEDGENPIIRKVLMKTNALGLINYNGVSSLSDFGIENMNMIFDCLVEGCNEIKTIICGNETSKAVLEWLKNLRINNVPNLENIWQGQGPVHTRSLSRLTTVTLSKCPKLKKIFSEDMIQQLLQLTHLRVEECHQIGEIIMESEDTQLENQAFPKLETLALIDLPLLTSIWAKDPLEWPSLQEVEISNCFMLKSLPFNKFNATKLRSIEGQQLWWEALAWEDYAIKERLQPLCVLN